MIGFTQHVVAATEAGWAPKVLTEQKWVGNYQGINLDEPSPTADNETVGQTLCRIGCTLFTETQEPGTSGPADETAKEAQDLAAKYGRPVFEVLDSAITVGLTKSLDGNPLSVLMSTIAGPHMAHLPPDERNVRYSVGRVSSDIFDDFDDAAFDEL